MNYLLDTNVISLMAPSKRRSGDAGRLAAWIIEHSGALWLSAVTAAEVESGIAKAVRTGATRKARDVAEWWGEVRHYYSDRILPLDLETAEETGRLLDLARAAGISPGFEDLAIAATGKRHGLAVLTQNDRDFRPLGIDVVNPLAALPD